MLSVGGVFVNHFRVLHCWIRSKVHLESYSTSARGLFSLQSITAALGSACLHIPGARPHCGASTCMEGCQERRGTRGISADGVCAAHRTVRSPLPWGMLFGLPLLSHARGWLPRRPALLVGPRCPLLWRPRGRQATPRVTPSPVTYTFTEAELDTILEWRMEEGRYD